MSVSTETPSWAPPLAGGEALPPIPPDADDLQGNQNPEQDAPWLLIAGGIVLVTILIVIAVASTVAYMNRQNDEQRRQDKAATALQNVNDRVNTQNIPGKFTEVFYVGSNDAMRARYVSADGMMRCNVVVNPPTSNVLRYTTEAFPVDKASWALLDNRDALGCIGPKDITQVGDGVKPVGGG